MIITKQALPRRTVLRGLGVALALPLLDSMVPALTALAKTAAKPIMRFGAVYLPNGVIPQAWTPAAEGAAFDLTPTLQPLAPFRDRLLVLSGLSSNLPAVLDPYVGAAVHSRASTRFLTDVYPGRGLQAGTSMDQMAAKVIGQDTPLASLELALEAIDETGACDAGSCAYLGTISWSNPTTPLPMEYDPRTVFERLFGDSQTTDPTARRIRMRQKRSILDSVRQKVEILQRGLGPADRRKLNEYVEAVRDVERRIQMVEQQHTQALPVIDQPAAIPSAFEEHAKLMFDLQVLAYQADLTRIITFMIGREFSGRTYPEIGVPDAHHPVTHHQNNPDRVAKCANINRYHTTLFAHYLQKLRSTPDGDGSLLDQVAIIYGAGMRDGNGHSPEDLPMLLVGGGAGQLQGGRHIRYPKDTPLANLHLTLLDKLGVPVEQIGDSSGRVEHLSAV